jgi:hypothetical protein
MEGLTARDLAFFRAGARRDAMHAFMQSALGYCGGRGGCFDAPGAGSAQFYGVLRMFDIGLKQRVCA